MGATLARVWLNRPNLDEVFQKLTNIGPTRPSLVVMCCFGRCWSTSGRVRPNLVDLGPILAGPDLSPTWPSLAGHGPRSTKFGRFGLSVGWPKSDQFRSNFGRFRQHLADLSRTRAKVAPIDPCFNPGVGFTCGHHRDAHLSRRKPPARAQGMPSARLRSSTTG